MGRKPLNRGTPTVFITVSGVRHSFTITMLKKNDEKIRAEIQKIAEEINKDGTTKTVTFPLLSLPSAPVQQPFPLLIPEGAAPILAPLKLPLIKLP